MGVLQQLVEEQRTLAFQHVQHPPGARRRLRLGSAGQGHPQRQPAPRQQHDRRAAHRPGAGRLPPGQASPDHPTGAAQRIQPGAVVAFEARRQQLAFPGGGRRLIALQLLEHGRHGVRPFATGRRGKPLPVEQEAQEIAALHRLDLPAQTLDRVAMDARQQVPLAPLFLAAARGEAPTQHIALALQRGQRLRHRTGRLRQGAGDARQRQRASARQARAHHIHPHGVLIADFCERGGNRQPRRVFGVGIQHAKLRQALQRQPQAFTYRNAHARRPPAGGQRLQQRRPLRIAAAFRIGQAGQGHQRLVQLVGGARLRPGFLGHGENGLGIQLAQVVGGLRVAPAPRQHRLRAPLLQRRVVEKGVGPRAEHLGGQGRGLRQVALQQTHLAGLHAAQQGQPAFAVHSFVQAVLQGLRHQRMVGNLALADDVFQAGHLIGEYRGQQIFAAHALNLRRHLAPAAHARQGQGDPGHPAPAHAEQRRVEQRLDQHLLGARRTQVAPDLVEGKAVAGGQREDDGVLGGRRLQLEVERAAEALAQRQPPSAVDATAKRRMDDQLRAAGFVEEALHHQTVLRGQRAQRGLGAGQVVDDLLGGGQRQAELVGEPGDGRRQAVGCVPLHQWRPTNACGGQRCVFDRPTGLHALRRVDNVFLVHRGRPAEGIGDQPPLHLPAQAPHGGGQRVAAPRRLAEPEGNVRWLAMGVLHAHPPGFDAQDAVGLVAELEHVAGQAFHREVLVHRADVQRLGFEQHRVIGSLRNGAAAGQRGQLRAAPAAQGAGHRVTVQVGAVRAVPARIALGKHAQQRLIVRFIQVGIGLGAADQRQQRVLAPFLAGHLGDDLLGQHVQRRARDMQLIQLATPHGIE